MVETDINGIPRSATNRRARALVAGLVAFIVATPAVLAPPAVLGVSHPEPTPTTLRDGADGDPDAHGSAGGDTDPEANGDGITSIQYEQAMEHAGDVIDFDPGDRVAVGFSPRPGDEWDVDGRAPRALPAGNATGLQLRDAPAGSIWANGLPPGLAKRDADAVADGAVLPPVDAPIESPPPDAVDPASYVLGGSNDAAAAAAPVGASGLRREVFGFLPYWEVGDSSTTLDWRTLSTVAYFSVGCLSNGQLDKTEAGWSGWTSSKMTSIINAAHTNHTRVVLTISCFAWSSGGASRQAALLGSSTARSTLAKAAAAAVRDRGADGINLDFEPIVAGYSDEFTALVRQVRAELNRIAPGYQLTFDTMGSIGNQPIVDATAPGGADAVFIMGYDYRTDGSSNAGSIDPLAGPKYDLADTVKAYTAKISPSKVILGVPYYGRAWSTSSDRLNAATLSGAKYGYPSAPTYGQALDLVNAHGRRYDSVEQSPWTAYRKQTCTSTYGCVTAWRELYYDDAASLRLRYDLVNRTELRGAGIWALGYDGTRTELRNALADKFLSDKTPPVVGVTNLAQTQRDEGFRVSWTGWDDSTITSYELQVSVDGGAWTTWLPGTSVLSAIYRGRDGHTYAFRIRASDVHGNTSAWRSIDLASLTAPADLTVGGFANVLVDGLKMRAAPTTAGTIMATLAAGDALQVIGGPVSAEGYTWWQVSGPVHQWSPVDLIQVGGWIAAEGNGVTNAAPRRPVYATRVDAGITSLVLANGGDRVLTPNGDGSQDTLRISWTNEVDFDSLALRIFRTDGTYVGSQALGATGSGDHGYSWDGRLGGTLVPAGSYVVQLQGERGSATYSAPSASPVTSDQVARFGVAIGPRAPTSVATFAPTASVTKSGSVTWKLVFGAAIGNLSAADFSRSGTATACVIARPAGAAASWTLTLTGCSQGTVVLTLKARTVFDAVSNWGPVAAVSAPTVRIDRSAPVATGPRVALRGGTLGSPAAVVTLPARVSWTATDPGGSGVRSYEIKRSVDGAAFAPYASGVTGTYLDIGVVPGHTYRFEVRAVDAAGNVGAWVAGSTVRPYLPQQTHAGLSWSGTWTSATDPTMSGGSVRWATAAGARVSYSFTGRSIAWIATFGPNRGLARVYVDGTLVATVDCVAPTTVPRHVAFVKAWSGSGTHTIRIVVVGTPNRPRVDVDAFEVLR
jgi:spore germination protein YaaH